jgi:hypothetical protein
LHALISVSYKLGLFKVFIKPDGTGKAFSKYYKSPISKTHGYIRNMYVGIVAQYLYTGIFQKNYFKDIENIRNRVARNYLDVYGVDWVYGIRDEFYRFLERLRKI